MASKNKSGAGDPSNAAGSDLEGQTTLEDLEGQDDAEAEAEEAKPDPWTPKAGAACSVYLMLGGSGLKRVKGKITKLHKGGRADVDVSMPNGSVQSMTMGLAADHQFGAGYDAP